MNSPLTAFLQPLPREFLDYRYVGRRHFSGEAIAEFGRVLVARRCREVVPHVRLDVILWDAPAQQVHARKPYDNGALIIAPLVLFCLGVAASFVVILFA